MLNKLSPPPGSKKRIKREWDEEQEVPEKQVVGDIRDRIRVLAEEFLLGLKAARLPLR